MRVKIVDVAKEANVSVATVSRVVNNVPLVNEDTRQRVLAAIEKTGYKPNAIARSLKIQKTNTLGIMIPDISNPIYTDMVRGAEDVGSIYKYNTILTNTDFRDEREEESLDVLVEKQCDGIIYIGNDLTDEMKKLLDKANCEVVLGYVEDLDGNLSSVVVDNEAAAYELTDELIKKGHKKIAVIADGQHSQVSENRLKGIRKAIEDNELELDDNLFLEGKIDLNGGFNLTKELLEKDEDLDLILAINDQVALGAIKAIQDSGKSIPDDIAVAGFNDSWASGWINPSLTTVKLPMYDLGAMAARKLIKKIENNKEENSTIQIPYEIVYRQSTR